MSGIQSRSLGAPATSAGCFARPSFHWVCNVPVRVLYNSRQAAQDTSALVQLLYEFGKRVRMIDMGAFVITIGLRVFLPLPRLRLRPAWFCSTKDVKGAIEDMFVWHDAKRGAPLTT
jgi:hypothetical protein